VRYWSKIADFNVPHLYVAAPWSGGDRIRIRSISLAPEN